MIFPSQYAAKLEEILINTYGYGIKIPILKLKESQNPELSFLADYIYKNIFLGYTLKQWELKPEELDHSVTSRIPVHISRDDRYFQDIYQGIPKNGYSSIFEKMLNHPNIELRLNTEFKSEINNIKFDKLIFTGPIDYYFDYVHGPLPYRSIRFELETFDLDFFQEVSQVNYPNNYDFTRITEFKHFHRNQNKQISNTVIAKEFSLLHIPGQNDPYYPIPKPENEEIHKKYLNEIKKLNGTVTFAGRQADYKYYNMDQVIAVALQTFEKKIVNSL
jgi:UDP-galactopyranose mutase